jgi:hypothetical protein
MLPNASANLVTCLSHSARAHLCGVQPSGPSLKPPAWRVLPQSIHLSFSPLLVRQIFR